MQLRAESRITYSRTYREFRSLVDQNDPAEILSYVLSYKDDIAELSIEEQFDIYFIYSEHLFRFGRNREYCEIAQKIIESSIINNIKLHRGVNVFESVLSKMALALMARRETERGISILEQVLRINPVNLEAQGAMRRALFLKTKPHLQKFRLLGFISLILSAINSAVELFIVRPYFPGAAAEVEKARIALLITGIVILLFAEIYFRLQAESNCRMIIDRISDKKRKHCQNDTNPRQKNEME